MAVHPEDTALISNWFEYLISIIVAACGGALTYLFHTKASKAEIELLANEIRELRKDIRQLHDVLMRQANGNLFRF